MARTTRIIGHMVTHNELERYLPASITWLERLCDEVVIFDDLSTDGTDDYLRARGLTVGRRHPAELGFATDESFFRQTAWRFMEMSARPTFADWILCIDADEFLVPVADVNPRDALTDLVQWATARDRQELVFKVAEAFGWDGQNLSIRVDGYWGDISALRLVRWRPQSTFASRRQGGGSVPNGRGSRPLPAGTMRLLHLGYVREQDRQVRHQRYTNMPGHNPYHVASIRSRPLTVPWHGMIPDVLQ
ncbi:glycosyltransferase [Caudovirales GX15bay]|nr:glycosyltransferase [Caudovirales GX15bay]